MIPFAMFFLIAGSLAVWPCIFNLLSYKETDEKEEKGCLKSLVFLSVYTFVFVWFFVMKP